MKEINFLQGLGVVGLYVSAGICAGALIRLLVQQILQKKAGKTLSFDTPGLVVTVTLGMPLVMAIFYVVAFFLRWLLGLEFSALVVGLSNTAFCAFAFCLVELRIRAIIAQNAMRIAQP